ncbi:IS21 family transposase [Jeotgalibacillus proteolyticus]|uniref:IS21 family transposase n=1 Tax=Jeotgalibacillus proteolyticus TaxID=2082395 RepID=A0A2S5GHL6_9BACL|nr:IS21 family transposase [Jeotgalibacillus proteolyticus]PPA68454.1 IS21 family transposase [Jeotgalibacillus proteolyticus]PPA69219.1 IS21 family transposase [Jeotgalibacillus proteolyticus]PPA69936.1 IS21 family transposase [Jeotgalibacillus proteolyticus]PPA70535.1 IS21 family transposase [Jeotgalibacillus proteolyticus]PPA71758.1 IS21 family transposase [Jeotgalibacillus proteolyticus]
MLYIKIHELHKRKFKIAQIAKELKISRPTVYKYLGMTFEEAKTYTEQPLGKKKKLDLYKDWILAWLEEYPHLSSAQIYDWLLERYPDLLVGESTMRAYVKDIREVYQIEKEVTVRQYEAVPEQPMGKQLQVDWGITRQKTTDNKEIKLYFIAFVLAHSRQKYTEWQTHPFTTRDAIRCHENAFQFYGGRTEEIVYDQDNLIAVSENAGQLLLTTEFQSYVNERKFNVYLCRRADPESKGMIENVVKYVKGNFSDSRVFSDIEDWNERARQWLVRTGNHKVHQTTKKRPAEVFLLEKQHLQPVSSLLSYESTNNQSITRSVSKDNTIRYKSNRYSVPLGTYQTMSENLVWIEVKDEDYQTLVIRREAKGDVIAEHMISLEKGKLIQNRHHTRDRSKGVEEFKQHLISYFEDQIQATTYLDEISQRYPRYRRDQFVIINKIIQRYPALIDTVLTKCLTEKLYNANDFRDIAHHLDTLRDGPNEEVQSLHTILPKHSHIKASTRSLNAYTSILGGRS